MVEQEKDVWVFADWGRMNNRNDRLCFPSQTPYREMNDLFNTTISHKVSFVKVVFFKNPRLDRRG